MTMNNNTGILNAVPNQICIFLGNDRKVKVVLKSIIIEFSETFVSGTEKVLYQTNCQGWRSGFGKATVMVQA